MKRIVIVLLILLATITCSGIIEIFEMPEEGILLLHCHGFDRRIIMKFDLSNGERINDIELSNLTTFACCDEDDSIWVSDDGYLKKLDLDGNELLESKDEMHVYNIGIDYSRNNLWVVVPEGVQLLSYTDLSEIYVFNEPHYESSLAIDYSNGNCWVGDTDGGILYCYSPSGSILVTYEGFAEPVSVALDQRDGSCYVADRGVDKIIKVDKYGNEVFIIDTFSPCKIEVSPFDGSFYVADDIGIARYSSEGEYLGYKDLGDYPSFTINTYDATIWAKYEWGSDLKQLSSDLQTILQIIGTYSTYTGIVEIIH